MTFSIMTFSITINILRLIMLNVANNPFMLTVVVLSVIVLSVVMLNVANIPLSIKGFM